jgi:hypothetical protein
MVSGPLRIRPAPAEQSRLDVARGRLRDAVGAVSNLDQLLHSLRVGPKAILAILPDVAAACADIRSAADELLGFFERYLPSADAANALTGFIHSHVQELERELAAADARPMNAKHRLQLENVVDRAAQDLGAARWLLDLLDEALWGAPTRVSLHELVREAAKTPVSAAESVESIAVTLARAVDKAELVINPRVGIGMVGIGVAWVFAQRPIAVPHINLSPAVAESCGLTISSEPDEGDGLLLVRRPLIAPSLACLEAVAALTGGQANCEKNAARLSLAWPKAASAPAA